MVIPRQQLSSYEAGYGILLDRLVSKWMGQVSSIALFHVPLSTRQFQQ
jgi:hypothetical protein